MAEEFQNMYNMDPKGAKETKKAVEGAEKAIKSFSEKATTASDNLASLADIMRKVASSSTDLAIKSTPLISLASFNKSVFKSPAFAVFSCATFLFSC